MHWLGCVASSWPTSGLQDYFKIVLGSNLAGPLSWEAEWWEKLFKFICDTRNSLGRKHSLAGFLGFMLLSLLRASAFITLPGQTSSRHLGLDEAYHPQMLQKTNGSPLWIVTNSLWPSLVLNNFKQGGEKPMHCWESMKDLSDNLVLNQLVQTHLLQDHLKSCGLFTLILLGTAFFQLVPNDDHAQQKGPTS